MTDDTTTESSTDGRTDTETNATTEDGLSLRERARQKGKALGRATDPMEAHEQELRDEWDADGVDVFDLFLEWKAEDARPKTVDDYAVTFRQWKTHMAADDNLGGGGRHPAAPAPHHVRDFIQRRREEVEPTPNVSTTRKKVDYLGVTFEWLARKDYIPFGLSDLPDFDDIRDTYTFDRGGSEDKAVRTLDIETVRERLQSVTHLRDRAMIATQFLLGLRQGEVRNMQIQDLYIDDLDLREHYPEMGANDLLRDHDGDVIEDAVVIPSKHTRPGNKSSAHRIIPLNRELRRVLVDYLLMRPDAPDEPHLFLGKTHNRYLDDENVLNRVWRRAFPRDEFGETENYRAITSHYGRFFFTNWWTKDARGVMDRESVQWLRGDVTNGEDGPSQNETIDHYIWRDYEDIEATYRNHVFSLAL